MVIIFPTDTVYGIGTKIFDLEGINKIYEIKKRPKEKPLACLCASLDQIKSIAILNDDAEKLINAFLPGPLTLILKSKDEVKEKIGYETIGVRIPNYKLALDILKENGPMLTTSVNESGSNPINEYEDILVKYGKCVDEIYKSNEKSSALASTVVLMTTDSFKILREGEITLNMIENILNKKG